MSAPQYVVCPVCGADRFLLSRRIYTTKNDEQKKQKSWAAGENSSDEIVCASCTSRLRWNVESESYVVFETKGAITP